MSTDKTATAYTAAVMDATGDDMETVDLRTLSTDRLMVLRTEAAQSGDTALVSTIDSLS